MTRHSIPREFVATTHNNYYTTDENKNSIYQLTKTVKHFYLVQHLISIAQQFKSKGFADSKTKTPAQHPSSTILHQQHQCHKNSCIQRTISMQSKCRNHLDHRNIHGHLADVTEKKSRHILNFSLSSTGKGNKLKSMLV